jgi:glycosyltransferase involved in cell wall biosynthesis
MRVDHITASVTEQGGGIPIALRALASAQARAGIIPRVIGHHDGGTIINGWPDDCPSALPVARFPGIAWANTMNETLTRSFADLLHVHGLWSQASILVRRIHRSRGIGYLVSPHGMLDAWALANSRWKKRLASVLFEHRSLSKAACLHALCHSEKDSIRAYGLKNAIAVIPNGVDLVNAETLKTEKLRSEKKILLFLGRLHPKKGLVNALRAWSKIRSQGSKVTGQEEWQFVIAGWDQGGHEAELKRLCDALGLAYSDIPAAEFAGVSTTEPERPTPLGTSGRARRSSPSVIFVGPAFGETKDALLRQASAFILPSFSEGLPMSVLEAWSYGLPVLMTDHCNLPEGFAADAAIRIGTDVESIAEGMRLLVRSPRSDLQSLGRNGRMLVERQFTWPQVAAQMKQVYEWMLGGGVAPDCVRK